MTAPIRRRLRFSLRTLLLLVALVCALTAWTIHNWRQVRERKWLLREFCARGAALGPIFAPGEPIIYKEAGSLPWSWRFFGAADPGSDIWLPPGKFTEAERSRLQSLFPDAYVVWWDEERQELLEREDPVGDFPALWKCPQCAHLWRGRFKSRAAAEAAARQEIERHQAASHP